MNHKLNLLFIFLLCFKMAISSNEVLNSANSLSGKTIKVSIGQYSDATIIIRNSSGHAIGFGGYMYEELYWISLNLNFSLDIFAFEDDQIDFWSEMRGQIRREEIDIACGTFLGLGFYYMLDLAVYVTGYPIGILTPYPKPKTSSYGQVSIFSPEVWIGWFLSILACVGFIGFLVYLKRKFIYKENDNVRGFASWSDIGIYVFATLTNHGGHFQKTFRSVGIIATAWCLATFVFVYVYSTCLTSYMSLTFQKSEINSFQDLTTNPNYQLAIVKKDVPDWLFMMAESGTWKNIGDKIRQCPDDFCHTINSKQAAERVLDGKSVAILPVPFIENYMYQTFSKNHQCNLTMAQETIAYRHYFMAVPKKSPYVSELNQASYWWHAFGFQSYWERKMLQRAPQCQLKYNSKGESVKMVENARLKLEQFYVAFIALFVGCILALMQFIREQFIYNLRQ